ncbi:MAG: hypothetical protein WAQ28_03685 [Bacteroidia bacterium]
MRFELNVDNDIWGCILVTTELLFGDKSAEKFYNIFLSNGDLRTYIFEVIVGTDCMIVTIDKSSLDYKLTVSGKNSHYFVNFEHERNNTFDCGMANYEILHNRFCQLIKKYRASTTTKLQLIP